MPAFVLDTSGAVPANLANPITSWDNLDAFTQGYIEALFFTESDIGGTRETFDPENGSALPCDAAFDDLDPDTLGRIVEDCAAFQTKAAVLLDAAYNAGDGYDAQRAGMDLWLTRNGHGAGFFDRGDMMDPDTADALDDLCGWHTAFPEVNVYLGDDGKVYLA